jgi:hypothetical protein
LTYLLCDDELIMMKVSATSILNSPSIQHVRLDDKQRVFVVGDLDGNYKRHMNFQVVFLQIYLNNQKHLSTLQTEF